jgi:PDZ domain-containing protein
VASLILAAVAYLLWNSQLHAYLNTASLFLILFNVALAVINFTPVFPLDGGRLMRAIGWGLLLRPAATTRLARQLGFLYAALLMAWGIILIVQQARFSWQTGAGTCLLAALILLPLFVQPGWSWDRAEPARPPLWSIILVRAPINAILIIAMLGVAVAIVPTVSGLEAPGIAPPVDPMIEVPAEYRHPTTGQFLLTTVFSQTPITVGQWLIGQLSPVVRLVPPERIVPADTTIQDLARRNFRMLDDSQTSAVAVGLRLAGYETKIEGLGARVLSILPDSPASELLQPGDVIIAVNGDSVGAVSELIARLRLYNPQDTVQLKLERNTRLVEAAVPLMAPSEPDQPPRIGISVEDAGVEVELPFPVEINPQKIVGGPSAGLMFTLTVYNMVTPKDLTGGRIIAGTGAINLDGSVGPIGGVQQKVAGAEFAGAEYFLSPAENYDDARTVARRITVVEVATAEEAIQFLRNLPAPD